MYVRYHAIWPLAELIADGAIRRRIFLHSAHTPSALERVAVMANLFGAGSVANVDFCGFPRAKSVP